MGLTGNHDTKGGNRRGMKHVQHVVQTCTLAAQQKHLSTDSTTSRVVLVLVLHTWPCHVPPQHTPHPLATSAPPYSLTAVPPSSYCYPDRSSLTALAHAVYWCRDMITTPAEDMGPQHLEAEAAALVAHHEGAVLHTITGDDLLKENYPAVHTVGRASAR